MARVLGRIEYADGTLRYFVHCETAGASFRPLFNSAEDAYDTYRIVGVRGLGAIPCHSRDVQVVKFAMGSGWEINDKEDGSAVDAYGLATVDAFLYPLTAYSDGRYLQGAGNVIHIAKEACGGMDGNYHAPICAPNSSYDENAKLAPLSEGFGRRLNLCPCCVTALIN